MSIGGVVLGLLNIVVVVIVLLLIGAVRVFVSSGVEGMQSAAGSRRLQTS